MVSYSKNNHLIVFLILFFVLSCKSDKTDVEVRSEKEYVMYQPSEMAVLMQEFYEYNEQLKKEIIAGEQLTHMPEEFKSIHTAEMTDSSGPSKIFKAYAPVYLQTQLRVTDSLDNTELRTRYNDNINMCLSCHKTECVGPIPRIKKLLIQ